MDSIYLENFRCFKKGRKIPLAPLTLLVGENSTGKTSFMAMIQALWSMVYERGDPNFNKAPYDLGNFYETVHSDGGRTKRKFVGGFEINGGRSGEAFSMGITFGERHGMPSPVEVSISNEESWYRSKFVRRNWEIHVGTKNGSWQIRPVKLPSIQTPVEDNYWGGNTTFLLSMVHPYLDKMFVTHCWHPDNGNSAPRDSDVQQIEKLISDFEGESLFSSKSLFSMAPIRSKPLRVYAPSSIKKNSEGSNIPSYLAEISHQGGKRWDSLIQSLKIYGQGSGLFDEISIHHLGNEQGVPFQIKVRKHHKKIKGQWRNLTDVGYGINQILPIIVELSQVSPTTYLLQQPEVHLHPRAQAALGTFFFNLVTTSKARIVVETHSDYLLDRIRMEVRENNLKPENVSILYFEQVDKDVAIRPMSLNERGKIIDPPPSYGEFFMNEIHRSFGFR